mgnify:CR=1 FL=1
MVMKIRILLLPILFLSLMLNDIQAQISGQNPELKINKNNGYNPLTGRNPVVDGDLLGSILLQGWVNDGFYHPGATLSATATGTISNDGFPAMLQMSTGYPSLTPRMTITAEGLVGVGTEAPAFELHTEGNTHTTGDFYGRIHFDDNQTADDGPITYVDEAYFELKQRNVVGLAEGSGTHGGMLTLSPGASSHDHQLFFDESGIFTRRAAGNEPAWGTDWYQLLSSNEISGSQNYVAKFTGSSQLGPSQLWDDGDQVGIGTDNPAPGFFLEVEGNTRIEGNTTLTEALNVWGRLSLGSNQFAGLAYNIGASELYIDNQAGDIRFHAAGEDMMTISDTEVDVKKRITVTGADLAERFRVNTIEPHSRPQPGMLLSIDPEHPGELKLSQHAHDRLVAGVVSGANGIQTAMLLGQEGTIADGDVPVAIVGRVYCYVDASYGPVQPGDLLTTSATPGHAMKVQDYATAQGAIVGKAMTSLEEGRGLVLVLVSMQ